VSKLKGKKTKQIYFVIWYDLIKSLRVSTLSAVRANFFKEVQQKFFNEKNLVFSGSPTHVGGAKGFIPASHRWRVSPAHLRVKPC
jgi:hypothetical protein